MIACYISVRMIEIMIVHPNSGRAFPVLKLFAGVNLLVAAFCIIALGSSGVVSGVGALAGGAFEPR
jgi:hypothetical protein